ncbi:MAG: hypothetical protein L6Q26_09550 [Anaerolineales bacterium]|nr:hypothetical protein [Anaerolineales bacterium]NUQ84021.1 hypothetical protein [Anaerolineales bacterium]
MKGQQTIRALYRRLLKFYPRRFREQLAEPMEQTFNDLYNEKRQAKQGLVGFMIRTFTETAVGIIREHIFLLKGMNLMLTNLKSSALISLLISLPFMVMQIVNRRNYNEDFPFALFFILWLNLFAVSLILLPIVQGLRTAKQNMTNPPAQGNTLLTSPKPTAIISIALFLIPITLFFLTSIGWEPLNRLLTGPNPGQLYVPGQIIVLGLISIPVSAGIIAGRPIVSTLRAGGSLFAHPIHLMIVVVISFLFAAGVVGLIMDQWPCFMGIPNCD